MSFCFGPRGTSGSIQPLQIEDQEQPKRRDEDAQLDRITTLGVNASTFVFMALQLPQLIQNFRQEDEALKELKWTGFLAGCLGNVSLMSYFTGISEWAQVRVQGIGAFTAYLIECQIFKAGHFPAQYFIPMSLTLITGLGIPTLYILGHLPLDAFFLWKELTTAVGLAGLLFAFAATFTGEDAVLVACSVLGLTCGLLILKFKTKYPALAAMTSTLGGWLATLLFMWAPVPQIIVHLSGGDAALEAVGAYSLGVPLLATIGNGLGVARAVYIKDKIWFVGSFWGIMVAGWLTMSSLWCVNPAKCPGWALSLYTLAVAAYFAAIIYLNGQAKCESWKEQFAFAYS